MKMLQVEDFVYHALLWKKPQERFHYLKTVCSLDDLDRALYLLGELEYPKLYNTSLARYVAFVQDGSEPIGSFETRKLAWESLHDKGATGYVVDVPIVELEKPRYDEYYREYAFQNIEPSDANE